MANVDISACLAPGLAAKEKEAGQRRRRQRGRGPVQILSLLLSILLVNKENNE